MCICHLRMYSSRITYSTVQSHFEVILSSIWSIFQTKESGSNYLLQCNYLLLKKTYKNKNKSVDSLVVISKTKKMTYLTKAYAWSECRRPTGRRRQQKSVIQKSKSANAGHQFSVSSVCFRMVLAPGKWMKITAIQRAAYLIRNQREALWPSGPTWLAIICRGLYSKFR